MIFSKEIKAQTNYTPKMRCFLKKSTIYQLNVTTLIIFAAMSSTPAFVYPLRLSIFHMHTKDLRFC